jgi:hypothetical protein
MTMATINGGTIILALLTSPHSSLTQIAPLATGHHERYTVTVGGTYTTSP